MDGGVWYVDYARGFLAQFDPKSGKVEEWQTPGGGDLVRNGQEHHRPGAGAVARQWRNGATPSGFGVIGGSGAWIIPGESATLAGVEFEWDAEKAVRNLRKHGVSFAEAATVLGDPLGVTAPDPDHSIGEDRSITVGRSVHGRVLLVAHTERGHRIRIISARELTRSEREAYEEETSG